MSVAIISGIEGQDGSWLAEYLLDTGYQVIGIVRRKSSNSNISNNISSILSNPNLKISYGDITDSSYINEIVKWYRPDMYFNLAAMSHVGQSFSEPLSTFNVDATAVLIALDALKQHSIKTRFYQASTSELFGATPCPTTGFIESDRFHPRSPYGIAKLAAFHATVNYREAYNMFACNGILFNHSSTRRGFDFATRKITRGVANIVAGNQDKLLMGNMDAFRDEGHAKDYVKAMHMILSREEPEDFIVATGEGATIKEMLEYVCELAGLKYDDVYEQDDRFMRPSDVPYLLGNPSKINKIGWTPEYNWKSLLKEMYENDLAEIKGLKA